MGHESGHAISIQNCYLWFGHFSKHHNDHQEESTNEQGYERRRDEEGYEDEQKKEKEEKENQTNKEDG